MKNRQCSPWRGVWCVVLGLVSIQCTGEAEGTPVEASGTEVDAGELARLGASGRAKHYDLLLITLDTVREDHLGCSGYGPAETPVIDRLAQTGIRFEHAIAAAPITLPSHATLLTGLDVPKHGVRNNGTFSLGVEHATLAESFATAGYRTAAFIGAYVLDARYGLARGFEEYDDRVNPSGSERTSGHFNERSASQVTDAALRWMESADAQGASQPRFTWVHYFDAHHPYEPPGEFGARFRSRPYDGEIAYIDSQIARLVEHLESTGRAERTLVLITSDHGEGLGEHGEATHSRLLYDSTLRVPLILSCASLFPAAVVVRDRVVGLVDVMPTVLELFGLQQIAGLDGRSLLVTEPDADRSLYVETLVPLFNHGWAPLQGLHRLEDKFISAPESEYYDVELDPGELHNLFPERPAAAVELQSRLAVYLEGEGSAFELRNTEKGMDAEQAKRLAALGYTRSSSGGAPVGVLDPKHMMPIWSLMMEARALTDAGQHAQALEENDVVLAQNPGDAYAWETASLIYVRTGRNAEAEAALQRMLEIQPTAEAYVRLAQLQLQRGDFGAMGGTLALAEALDPREGGVHMVAGDAFASQGRFVEALAAFERALQLDAVKWGALAREKIELVRERVR